jgi:hypothetical protein
MYMHKDCKIKHKINNFIKTLALIHIFVLTIHLYLTSYQDKFKKVKTKYHFRNNLNVYKYTKINYFIKNKAKS